MQNFLGYILPTIIILALLCLGTWIYLRIRAKAGDAWEQKAVSRVLRSFARIRGGRVIDQVLLTDEGHFGWAHHLLIAPFGILLVYDLCFTGAYSGKPEDKDWGLHLEGKGRWRVTNPLPFSGACSGRVNTLLKKEGIKAPVYSVVVLASTSRQTSSFIKSEDVVTFRKLRSYLNKSKFDQDLELDTEKIEKILLAAHPDENDPSIAEKMALS